MGPDHGHNEGVLHLKGLIGFRVDETVVVFLKFVGQVEETKCGRRNLLDVWRPH